ncbi:MAG: 50S ribosomal protein L29 [Bacteroidaceae bacterium]|nr:50S ribosomal protein L29 [Bacteroidaceae bacterium]
MKIEEIRALSPAELRERIETETANYETLKFNHQVTPLENPSLLKKARKTIARLKTVLREVETNN